MLNEQLYNFYNLDFKILKTSHENDLYYILIQLGINDIF